MDTYYYFAAVAAASFPIFFSQLLSLYPGLSSIRFIHESNGNNIENI